MRFVIPEKDLERHNRQKNIKEKTKLLNLSSEKRLQIYKLE